MTLKEKAEQLVYYTFWLDGMDFENSKECALIAVDLAIEVETNIFKGKVNKSYWYEVKKEIENI